MPAIKPGYVRNMIRRSLREIVDPSPTKQDEERIWEFFNSECKGASPMSGAIT